MEKDTHVLEKITDLCIKKYASCHCFSPKGQPLGYISPVLENNRFLSCLFWNFYRNSTPCSGIFVENESAKCRHVPDCSDMEVMTPKGA